MLHILTVTLRKKRPYSELFWSAFPRLFPAFGLNTESPNTRKCGKNADQNNSKYGHFLRAVLVTKSNLKNTCHVNNCLSDLFYLGIRKYLMFEVFTTNAITVRQASKTRNS